MINFFQPVRAINRPLHTIVHYHTYLITISIRLFAVRKVRTVVVIIWYTVTIPTKNDTIQSATLNGILRYALQEKKLPY